MDRRLFLLGSGAAGIGLGIAHETVNAYTQPFPFEARPLKLGLASASLRANKPQNTIVAFAKVGREASLVNNPEPEASGPVNDWLNRINGQDSSFELILRSNNARAFTNTYHSIDIDYVSVIHTGEVLSFTAWSLRPMLQGGNGPGIMASATLGSLKGLAIRAVDWHGVETTQWLGLGGAFTLESGAVFVLAGQRPQSGLHPSLSLGDYTGNLNKPMAYGVDFPYLSLLVS